MSVFLANAYVTIQRTQSDGTVMQILNVPCDIHPSLGDNAVRAFSLEFTIAAHFPGETRFLDGTPIQQGDEMLWSGFINGRAIIHRPSIYYQLLPIAHCFLNDTE